MNDFWGEEQTTEQENHVLTTSLTSGLGGGAQTNNPDSFSGTGAADFKAWFFTAL